LEFFGCPLIFDFNPFKPYFLIASYFEFHCSDVAEYMEQIKTFSSLIREEKMTISWFGGIFFDLSDFKW